MPRTRRDPATPSINEEDVDDDRGSDDAASYSSSQVAAMMAAMQRTQSEAFETLLERLMSRQPSSPVPAPTTPQTAGSTFTQCTARFGGDASESVDAFIDAIQSFKECANVSEQNALRGLSMLLTNNAAIWYQGVKKEITSWDMAINLLIVTYGDKRPPHRIYRELFSLEQGDENTDVFVAKCRALLSRIPEGDLSEKAQVDMVYGLLDSKIRKYLRREEFKDFSGMLRLARSTEIESETHSQSPAGAVHSARSKFANGGGCSGVAARSLWPPPPPRRSAAPTSSSGTYTAATATTSATSSSLRSPVDRNSASAKVRCVYCKQYGHIRDDCKKLNKCG